MLMSVRLELLDALLPFLHQRFVTFAAPWINDIVFVLAVPSADAGVGGCLCLDTETLDGLCQLLDACLE